MPRESHASVAEGSAPGEAGGTGTGTAVRVRWWQRVLPVTALAVLAAAATVTLAGGNDQIKLSTTRQEQPFVELGLTRSPLQVCSAGRPLLRFNVVSHLATARTLRFTVATVPALKGQERFARQGGVEIAPGATRSLRTRLRPPARGAYDVAVTIQDRPEALRVHCAAPKPSKPSKTSKTAETSGTAAGGSR